MAEQSTQLVQKLWNSCGSMATKVNLDKDGTRRVQDRPISDLNLRAGDRLSLFRVMEPNSDAVLDCAHWL